MVLLGTGVDKGGLGVLVLVLLAENGLFTTCEERTKQLTPEDQRIKSCSPGPTLTLTLLVR